MSQPNIPNITPTITIDRDDVINLLLASIALEELGLAHIINAEAEKIQYVLGTIPGLTPRATLDQILAVNDSVEDMLDLVIKKELLLTSKLKEVINSIPPTP
ncbi:hypothetical protein [Psychrobacillus sp. BM2]|uniref:hypothetical protein n=1 Tax=Psychrobacillus sp. BM2 TaxID=3400421 RepID=UPI003B02E7CA